MRARIAWLLFLAVVLGGVASAAAAPRVEFSADRGEDIPLGTPHRMMNWLANEGDTALTVTRLELTGEVPSHFEFASAAEPSCPTGTVCTEPFTVEPGGSIELDVVCRVDRPAVFRATLTITSNAANSPASWSLLCDGAGPHIEFTGSTVFPLTRVGEWSAPQVLQIRNTGNPLNFIIFQAPDFANSLPSNCRGDPCELRTGVPLTAEIAFAPRTSGPVSQQMVLATDQGDIGVTLTGIATGPTLTLEAPQSPSLELGTARLGEATPPGEIRIRNTGDAVLHVSRVALRDGGDSEPSEIRSGAPGPFDLAPGATARWQVICRPSRVGENFSDVQIENDGGVPETSVSIHCIGLGGSLTLAPAQPEFAATALGETAVLPVTLHNDGNAPATITRITSDDAQFTAALHAGELPITLPVRGSAVIDLGFAPSRPGPLSASIALDNDGKALSIAVTGFGLSGRADVTPEPVIGDVPVGTTGELRLVLANHSDRTIILASIAIADPAQFAIAGPSGIGTPLAPGQQLPLTLRATPASLGRQTTEITFGFDGGPATTITASVHGTAATLAVATWDDAPLDDTLALGRIAVGGERQGLISITNAGTAPLSIASCELAGDAAFTATTECPVVLAPRASTDLAIQFAPDAPGPHTATLAIASDVAPMTVTLRGEATARPAGCAASPSDSGGLAVVVAALGIAARGRRRRHAALIAALALASCDPAADAGEPVARRSTVTVTRAGTGEGTVTSLAPGIACGERCTASFDAALHLAATAAPGSMFSGWDGACAGTGACVVRAADTPADVVARFERQVTLTITARAPISPVAAEVLIDRLPCALPCTRRVVPGTTVTLDVLTLSTFTGWSGGCSPQAAQCRLTVTQDTELIAEIATPDEQWTAVDDIAPQAVTVVGDDPVVAGVAGNDLVIARYTAAGAPSWRTRITAGADPEIVGLDHDAAGRIYVLTHTSAPDSPLGTLQIDQLGGDGRALWSRVLRDTATVEIRFVAFGERRELDALAAIASGGAVVLGVAAPADTFVRAYADDGSVRWTQRLPTRPIDVSLDTGGTATVISEIRLGSGMQVDRFDAAGAPVAHYDLPRLQFNDFPDLSYQAFALAGGQLICQSADDLGASTRLRALDAATGVTRWAIDDPARVIPGPTVLGVDGLGNTVMLDARSTVRKLTGRSIRWQRAPSHSKSPGGAFDVLDARDIAGDARGRVIVVGVWRRPCAGSAPCSGEERLSGFVRAYDP